MFCVKLHYLRKLIRFDCETNHNEIEYKMCISCQKWELSLIYEHVYCQIYFLIISIFETPHFLKSCPILFSKHNDFFQVCQFLAKILKLMIRFYIYFMISTGLLGLEETYWFCRFEKPRSHLLHEQFAASPLFYQQPTQICLQNAYWGRRQVIYQGVLKR